MMFSACGLTSSTTSGPITIQLFFHSGQEPEREALNATLKAFSDRNPGITVDAVQLPEGRYTDQVNIAALAHSLPCLLDFDGPTLYNYAWSGYLIPLDKYVSPEMKAAFLPSIIQQGTHNHHLYSLGQFDSGLGLYANKHYLSKVGVPLLLMVNQLPWFDGSTTWIDSYQVQIIPFIAGAFSIFLFYQFFMDIPKAFEEAALVDGASRLRVYWQVVVPLSRPVFCHCRDLAGSHPPGRLPLAAAGRSW